MHFDLFSLPDTIFAICFSIQNFDIPSDEIYRPIHVNSSTSVSKDKGNNVRRHNNKKFLLICGFYKNKGHSIETFLHGIKARFSFFFFFFLSAALTV